MAKEVKRKKKQDENNDLPKPVKKAGPKEIIRRIFFVIALGVFLFSAGKLIQYGWTYYNANKGYKDLWNQVTLGPNDVASNSTAQVTGENQTSPEKDPTIVIGGDGVIQETIPGQTEATTEAVTVHVRQDILPPDYPGVNHNLLMQMNSDYVGFLYIPGTLVNYPVVQGSDNSHYLRYDFNGKEVLSGCPFLDYQQEKDLSLFNSTICAHNQKDDRMFGTLSRYSDQKFCEENPYIYFMTPNGAYRYRVFAAYEVYYISTVFNSFYPTEQAKNDLIKTINNNKLYDTGIKVTAKDHILTLYTCTSDPAIRFVVHAVCENY